MATWRYIAAQDLAHLSVGTLLSEAGAWRFAAEPIEIAASPEEYARHILSDSGDLAGFVIVNSPGSATTLRVSLSLVNAFAFTKNLPVISVEKPLEAPASYILAQLTEAQPHAFAVPRYTNAPKITVATHDQLKRKI